MKYLATTTLMISLAGCSSFNEVNDIGAQATSAMNNNAVPAPQVVQTVDAPYLLGDAVTIAPTTPTILDQPITLVVAEPESLNAIAAQIAQITGISVSVDGTNNTLGSSPSAGSAGGLPPPPAALLAAASDTTDMPNITIRYPAPGGGDSLKGLLNTVASRAGDSWRFENGGIIFFTVETKTFELPAINEITTSQNQIVASAGANAASSNSSGTQGISNNDASTGSTTITDSTTVDIWKDITQTAKVVSDGAAVSADPSTGTLTVVGTPDQINQVADWVDQLSDTLAKNVAVDIDIYSVQISNEQNYGVNPTVAFNNAAKSVGLTLTGVSAPAVQGSATPASFGASILSSATGEAGEFSGSQAAVQALATLGKTNQIFHRSILTLNDESAPIQNATQTGYLESTTISDTANVGTNASLIPGSVTTGFTGNLTPRVVNNKIILDIDLTISSLIGLTTESSNGSSIQVPTTTDTVLKQSASLQSGNTLMITGYEENDGTSTNNGVGSPFVPIFGGGGDAQVKHTLIAIVVTARTL